MSVYRLIPVQIVANSNMTKYRNCLLPSIYVLSSRFKFAFEENRLVRIGMWKKCWLIHTFFYLLETVNEYAHFYKLQWTFYPGIKCSSTVRRRLTPSASNTCTAARSAWPRTDTTHSSTGRWTSSSSSSIPGYSSTCRISNPDTR